MNIKFSPPGITEEEISAVAEALRSGWITTGPRTKLFEQQIAAYCGTKKAVCLNSATAGLELALKILGIGYGDEVITSAYTYTASASVIHHVGATIVLCDTAKDSFEMDYDLIPSLITNKTKAIIPVDIAGVMCDYDKIYSIVQNAKQIFQPSNDLQKRIGRIVVMADAAHSFGAVRNGKTSGAAADLTAFSFHAVKNLTTAEGGAVTWRSDIGLDDNDLYLQFMLWSLHGQSKDALAKTQIGSWEYDIIMCGQKCNMTDIMASIGIVQLNRYDSLLSCRKEIIEIYNRKLKCSALKVLQHSGSNFCGSGHLYLTRINGADAATRNQIITELAKMGIATNVHYKPLPMFTAYKNLGFNIADFPNAFMQYQNEITLPLHTLLTNEEVDYICEMYIALLERI